ncbi:uncharacterized protein LOC129762719 isoform X2 [Toxorhynchites rutilus septentrionalis]|uniref:uncharacterized protein LOC129762719 isoform X2 n=1 Tax=Toxorhynchites rutilus septentrionalis TaxID=329112 RepID=UPI00247B297E|nr:uncharacterized protein LOC129762719 isoform X2 [Toxorhynchites rutilus septentrionalis]
MNWNHGLIVGTVKPVASVENVQQQLCKEPQSLRRNTDTLSAECFVTPSSTNQNVSDKLQGTVSCSISAGTKIQGTVKVAESDVPIEPMDLLTQRAIKEIYRDTKMGSVRAAQVGALGWQSCPLKKTNKRFLNRTMTSVIQHNNRQTIRAFHSSTRKLIELDQRGDIRRRHRTRARSRKDDTEVFVIEDDNESNDSKVRIIDDSHEDNYV